jgi:choice-of-anchor A domain-containing protein
MTYINGESQEQNTLFNFYQAQSMTVNNGFYGSILAPYANVKATGGHINGILVANSYGQPNTNSSQMNDFPFKGDLPEVPEPATLMLVLTGAMLTMKRRKMV